jgi:putative ABC transport system permease protein
MAGRSFSHRLYHWFLRLFPSEFRGDFGDDMSQVFRDEHRDASRRGRGAMAGLWLRTIRGLAALASREHLHVLLRDARYGVRLMWKNRLTTAAAIVTIALGVGANTAMFTVVKAVLLELPFRDPDQLVVVLRQSERNQSLGINRSQFDVWKRQNGPFEAIGALWGASPVLTGTGETRRLSVECVSAGMFATLGVAPSAGRTFTDAEDVEGAPSVIVISHDFWMQRLGGDPRAVGRVLTLDDVPATILGIMPRAFDGPRAGSVRAGWLPLADCVWRNRNEGRLTNTVNVYARLKPGVSGPVAEAQLEAALERPGAVSGPGRVRLSPIANQILGEVRQPLLALLGAAAFVLLIACAKVASLLLGRADARRRELAMRFALGCTRARMVRQLLTESVLFAMCGGTAGLLIAYWSLQWMLALMPGWVPRLTHIEIDGRALVACLVLSMGTGLLFGLLPAWHASQVSPGSTLKESAVMAGPRRRRARAVLIVVEIALSVALLAGGGLLVKTFMYLRPVDPGFDPRGKVAVTINLPRPRYGDERSWRTFLEAFRRRLAEQPDVRAVTAASYLPLSGFISLADVQIEGSQASTTVTVDAPVVTPDFFAVMGIRIVRGRAFTIDDRAGASEVALVNETLARRLWPGEDPLGRQIVVKAQPATRFSTRTIVGVVQDVRRMGIRLGAGSELYVPFDQNPAPIMRVVVSTPRSADEIGPLLKSQVASIDPRLPVGDVESVSRITTERSVATWRFAASLMGAFAIVALLLASVGLFAVVGCWVTERTSEIGVRMALGASRGVVLRMFVGRAAFLLALGLVVGLTLAGFTTRFLATWLVNTSPLDRTSFAAAAAIMCAVCLVAAYLAARRAAAVDPLVALRTD